MTSRDESVLEEVRSFEVRDNEADFASLVELVAHIEEMVEPRSAIRPLFDLLERFPDAHFGSPGPIVHFLERFYRQGYEAELLSSTGRTPTSLTVWMLNRMVNGTKGRERERFLEELRRIAAAGLGEVSDQAEEFLADDEGPSPR